MLETILPIAGNLLGGLFGNRSAKKAAAQQRAWALEDQKMQFVRLREAADLGGFNPLTALGAAPGAGMVNPTPVSSNNFMGNAIAESSILMADSLARSKAATMGRTVEDLNRQRDILTRKLTQNTIRPKVAGVYGIGGINARPVQNMAVRNNSGNAPVPALDGFRPLEESNWVDPRRTVDNKPNTSTSGFMTVDNPYLPKPLRVPTLDGDEPLQWYDYPSLVVPGAIMAGEMFHDWYKKNQPYAPDGGKPGVRIPDPPVQPKTKPKKLREYWTHPQTGWSGVRN